MKLAARAVSILLLVSIIAALSSVPGASSQNLTTITSLQTVTTEGSITRTATATIQSTSLTTFTSTYFTTSLLAQTKKIQSVQTTIPVVSPQFGCTYYNTPFSAQAGQAITGTVSSDNEINFYILSPHEWDVWRSKTVCPADNPLIEALAITTFSFDIVIPGNGAYQFLLLNFSHDKSAIVDLNAQLVGTAKTSSTAVTSSDILQDYSTQTATAPVTLTQTLSSLRTEQIGFSLGGQNLLLAAVGLATVAIVVIIFVLRSRGGKPRTVLAEPEEVHLAKPAPPPPKPTARRVQTPPPGMKFCIHCGQAIPLSARFCTKISCGKPQD